MSPCSASLRILIFLNGCKINLGVEALDMKIPLFVYNIVFMFIVLQLTFLCKVLVHYIM